ncbi:hypothetical protein [Fundidesulfovibrio soli]|uniref:hypothetical protein n=1 Tax=Fundidesulfovibrio soli TaxID=2922716 RepID=UPI001FB00C34|nr:hypothetical protein [Fundidesulfovibrio soli]
MRMGNLSQDGTQPNKIRSFQIDPRDDALCLESDHAREAKAQAPHQFQPPNRTAWDIAREAYERVGHAQGTLPGVPVTPKGTAPMGNKLARTPLFAPIKRGRRKIHDMVRLPSPGGISLWYFGKQLDVSDQDTYLTALMLAKGVASDTPIKINRTEFLRLLGRKIGGSGFKWLEQSFARISTGRLFYDTPDEQGSTPLIGPLRYDKGAEEYYFTIPADSLRAFGVKSFGYVDMEKRRQIANKAELAKWLQCYAVSHAKGEHRVSVANLKAWCGHEGRVRDFRNYLATALAELVRVGILGSWGFYEDNGKIKWFR